jgi:cytidylate kinase
MNEAHEMLHESTRESPRHGYQGDRQGAVPAPRVPQSLTIAISREAGSRGGSIARRVGVKLGWQVYNQDLLEYLSQEHTSRRDLSESMTPELAAWSEQRLDQLLSQEGMTQHPSLLELARMILTLGAAGEAILVVRAAGFILPRNSTLHVRLVAPLADRVAYMSQWLRLTEQEAADEIQRRDERRAEFVQTHFHRRLSDPHHYDLVLNSCFLGEELCAELIVQAARAKLAHYIEHR